MDAVVLVLCGVAVLACFRLLTRSRRTAVSIQFHAVADDPFICALAEVNIDFVDPLSECPSHVNMRTLAQTPQYRLASVGVDSDCDGKTTFTYTFERVPVLEIEKCP